MCNYRNRKELRLLQGKMEREGRKVAIAMAADAQMAFITQRLT